MKRSVMAVIISAMALAALAASSTSCIWMPDFLETEKEKTEEPVIPLDDVLSVGELLAGDFSDDTVWVRGYIVGGISNDGSVDFGCAGTVLGTAVILADDTDCTEEDDCLALKLTKKAHKEALGLDKEENRKKILNQEIYVQGKVTTYKGFPALTNLCEYRLE
ncbi:MAG: hypothetical protein IKX34_06930 [Bacteroidales bacterium]|nr:hypothetical protein [Bacteroidales bacterium]